MAKALKRHSLADQIKDALIAQITAGDLKPGDRLVELRIAQEMQTSQAPVREALRELEALALIEMRHNRGSVVREVSETELRDIYTVRAELEGHAVEIATRAAPGLGDDLDALCDRMDQALAARDEARFVDLNHTFHQRIVEASENPVLLDIWTKLDIRARTASNIARRARPVSHALAEHRAVAQAVQSGDATGARMALQSHIMAVVGGARRD